MATTSPNPAEKPIDLISEGDAAASAGDWVTAVSRWEGALGSAQSARASERLRWFLSQESDKSTASPNRPRKVLLLGGAACALLGTGVVFWAQSVDGSLATMLSILTWLLYGAAAAAAILYARWSGPNDVDEAPPVDLAAAQSVAAALGEFPASESADVAR